MKATGLGVWTSNLVARDGNRGAVVRADRRATHDRVKCRVYLRSLDNVFVNDGVEEWGVTLLKNYKGGTHLTHKGEEEDITETFRVYLRGPKIGIWETTRFKFSKLK